MNDFSQARIFLIAGTIVSYGLIFFMTSLTGFQVSVEGGLDIVPIAALVFFLASALATCFNFLTLRSMIECCGCGLLLVVPITISTYLSTWLNFPLADNQLSRWDKWLGVNWTAMMGWIDQHPLLSEALNKAYRSFGYQLLLCPALLALAGHHGRAYQMVATYGLLCFLSSAISIFFPALGTYSYYQFDASSLQNIDPTYGYFFLEQFHAVRNDPDFIWRLEDSAGILTFPSVHAAVAALCAWALWPMRILRYPALALNLAMGFSAIPGANHYVVDVIAGVVVALAAIGFVTFATGSSRQKSLARPAPVGSVLVRSRS
ncbi:hypothetical protein BC374_17270 [Ensifer sp. LC13]|nr:hypothetical protein BC362_27400 [Ensifer sp. LC14]OCP11418.1 hypothetical protein BC374_17270 [Ensifer sp. LC13]OCP11940.1 hypothetical protein BBX50_17050 [Ensifer sp. LC11]OCP33449.1 hypothetical protein BC364_15945 [Ensifer sp. LC499]